MIATLADRLRALFQTRGTEGPKALTFDQIKEILGVRMRSRDLLRALGELVKERSIVETKEGFLTKGPTS